MALRRRRVLASVAAVAGSAAGAGCAGLGSGVTDITLDNESESEQTVTLVVTPTDGGDPLLDETVTLDAGGGTGYEEVVGDETVEVRVSVEGGPEETHEWSDTETDSHGLYIDVTGESISFTEGTA
ncbi:hypothetical protein [Halosimplex halophilum]|uniref:hypothetical protein n=1 Tax=Halosimplex halophilum TaxID=2559572 RepID=UPI00107FA1D1|nr:hypothetical protein [Halosimplex halophilum]